MRIIVFSDSHGDVNICKSVLDKLPKTDMVIHAGDCIGDAKKLEELFPNIEVKAVAGNCDYSAAPVDLVFDAGGKRFFLSHGHKYGVKFEYDYRTFCEKALSEGADAAIFGHTHVSYMKKEKGLLLLNPGSIKYGHTFGIIEIENEVISSDTCNADIWF